MLSISNVIGKKAEIGATAGSLAKAGMTARILGGSEREPIMGRLRVLPRYIQFRIMSRLLAGEWFRKWAGRTGSLDEWINPSSQTAVIASAPIFADIYQEFKDEKGKLNQVIEALRLGPSEGGGTTRISFDEWVMEGQQ